MYTSMIRIDTTILDHSRVFLSILRAPQISLKFADRGARSNCTSEFCTIWGLGKHAKHITGVAKVEGFVYTNMVRIDTTILDHSGVF